MRVAGWRVACLAVVAAVLAGCAPTPATSQSASASTAASKPVIDPASPTPGVTATTAVSAAASVEAARTPSPTLEPTPSPTLEPTPSPTPVLMQSPPPTAAPTSAPTVQPTAAPTLAPAPKSYLLAPPGANPPSGPQGTAFMLCFTGLPAGANPVTITRTFPDGRTSTTTMTDHPIEPDGTTCGRVMTTSRTPTGNAHRDGHSRWCLAFDLIRGHAVARNVVDTLSASARPAVCSASAT
jgi:hypothetical protein